MTYVIKDARTGKLYVVEPVKWLFDSRTGVSEPVEGLDAHGDSYLLTGDMYEVLQVRGSETLGAAPFDDDLRDAARTAARRVLERLDGTVRLNSAS